MPAQKSLVTLEPDQRRQLVARTMSGEFSPRTLNRAYILLAADDGQKDEGIAARLHVYISTVARVRRRFAKGGLEFALSEHHHPGFRPKINDEQAAFLIATAHSAPPEGQKKWTAELLTERLIQSKLVDSVSVKTVARALKKMR